MRKPDDKRVIEVVSAFWLTPSWRCAVSELMLLLMVADMMFLLLSPYKTAFLPTTTI
jgi:hypothetical protein